MLPSHFDHLSVVRTRGACQFTLHIAVDIPRAPCGDNDGDDSLWGADRFTKVPSLC